MDGLLSAPKDRMAVCGDCGRMWVVGDAGFTREDVLEHRAEADGWQKKANDAHAAKLTKTRDVFDAKAKWHRSMADRIEALLPPE